VIDGALYVGFERGKAVAFDTATGVERWAVPAGRFDVGAISPPYPGLRAVAVGSDMGDLIGLDTASGAEVWRVAVPGKVHFHLDQDGPPLTAGERIYVRNEDGGIVALGTARIGSVRAGSASGSNGIDSHTFPECVVVASVAGAG